ncbi:MAG: hypothetical protein JHC13_05185 [Acidilobus sp.]|nr:hypothetical protein [Acidilobus sp.]
MNRIGKLALVAGILAIALAVPIAAAHVIFVYQAQVTVKPVTPVVWLPGPDANYVSLSLTNKTSPQISLTIPITNSSETYVYQALKVEVIASSLNLYVDSCSYSGPALTSVKLIVYPATESGSPSSPAGTITINNPSSGCTASGTVSLTAGNTYYIDFLVQPSLPIPNGVSSGTLTIYFGLTSENAVTVPTS